MAEFELQCFSESGNAYKAALMLELCKADWKPVRVAFFAGETRSPQYRDKNVMGEAPVLVHHRKGGDLTLSQSGVILIHLARHFGQFNARNESEEYEILRWILFDNHKLTSYSATARFMGYFMKKTDDPATQFLAARAAGAWKVLNTHLEGREWVVGDRATIADLSLCGYLFWPEQIGANWDDYPNIKAWLERIRSLPGFKLPEALMPSGQDQQTQTA
ncbi:MAG: glutathione S-transferase family protein [Rhizobiaceae bacterium]